MKNENKNTYKNIIITSIITAILITSGIGVVYANPSLWTQNGNGVYYNTGNVGIGIITPSEKLEIQDGNFKIINNNLASGTAGASVINFGALHQDGSTGLRVDSTQPITYKDNLDGINAKVSSTSSLQNGYAQGRLASSGVWFDAGSFIGVNDSILGIIQQSYSCNELSIWAGNNTVQLINVECLQRDVSNNP